MPRRTIEISDSTELLVRLLARESEPLSAAATRLIEAGAAAGKPRPSYIGIASGPPQDLGRNHEKYLRAPHLD